MKTLKEEETHTNFFMTQCAAGFTGFMLDLIGWRCVEQTWNCFSSILLFVGCCWFIITNYFFFLFLLFFFFFFFFLGLWLCRTIGSVIYAVVWSSPVSSDVLVTGASSVLIGTISAYSVVSSLPRKQLDSSELFRSNSA